MSHVHALPHQCYDILAARISIGLESTDSQMVNLTRLRQKIRSRRDKMSGRKVPQSDDYEVFLYLKLSLWDLYWYNIEVQCRFFMKLMNENTLM